MTRANKPLILKIHSFYSSPGGTARLVCLLSLLPGDPASKPFSCPTPPTDAGVRARGVDRDGLETGPARRVTQFLQLSRGGGKALFRGPVSPGKGAARRDPDAAALSRRRRSGPVRRR